MKIKKLGYLFPINSTMRLNVTYPKEIISVSPIPQKNTPTSTKYDEYFAMRYRAATCHCLNFALASKILNLCNKIPWMLKSLGASKIEEVLV